MAEASAIGIHPHLAWDYTYRELAAALVGAEKVRTRDLQAKLWAAYQGEAFARTKRLPNLAALLRKLEPARVMSPKAVRQAVINMAMAMGAKVTRVPKG